MNYVDAHQGLGSLNRAFCLTGDREQCSMLLFAPPIVNTSRFRAIHSECNTESGHLRMPQASQCKTLVIFLLNNPRHMVFTNLHSGTDTSAGLVVHTGGSSNVVVCALGFQKHWAVCLSRRVMLEKALGQLRCLPDVRLHISRWHR
jgi:hypothetical protein